MSPIIGLPYTLEENMKMWKFVIRHPTERKGDKFWERFKIESGSKRKSDSLRSRYRALFSNLINTKFHVETKLQIFKGSGLKIGEMFLKQLEEHAHVELSPEGLVRKFTIKESAGKNRDLELDDESFIEAMALKPTPKNCLFTVEEDRQILEFRANHGKSSKGHWTAEYKRTTHSTREDESLIKRFQMKLLPNLHRVDVDIKTKLKIYRKFRVPVEGSYLKTLKEHADLEVDHKNVIISYRLKNSTEEEDASNQGDQNEGHEMEDVEELESVDADVLDVTMSSADDVDTGDMNDDDLVELEASINTEDVPSASDRKNELADYTTPLQFSEETVHESNKSLIETKSTSTNEVIEKVVGELKSSDNTVIGSIVENQPTRNEQSTAAPDDTRVHYKQFLMSLRTLATSLNLPSESEIERRIDEALRNLSESQNPLDETSISKLVEISSNLI